jgi:WD40 repeat protein
VVQSAVFSPEGDHVLTASHDGTARVWLVYGEDLLELAEERNTREFTQSERERYADLLDSGADPRED